MNIKNKYSTGKIYTIRCRYDDSLICVGSTIQPLCRRIASHRTSSKKYPNRLLYATINNDWDNWYIELHENWPCENREQLCKREGEVIREIATLNMNVAGRTKKEYYTDNKDKLFDKMKQYLTENTERIKLYQKEYQREYQREYRLRKKSENSGETEN